MDFLKGVLRFLYEGDNYITLIVCIGLLIKAVNKAKSYIKLTREEQIEVAKYQIKNRIMALITNAELDWDDWKGAGAIKRSEVLSLIYDQYPILEKVYNQEEITEWIDHLIDEGLEEMRKIFSDNDKTPEKPEDNEDANIE